MIYNVIAEAVLRSVIRVDSESELDAQKTVEKLIRDGRLELSSDGDLSSLSVIPVDEYFGGLTDWNNRTDLKFLRVNVDLTEKAGGLDVLCSSEKSQY